MGGHKERLENTQSLELEEQERLRLALSSTPMFIWEWEIATDKIVPLHAGLDMGGRACEEIFDWARAEAKKLLSAVSEQL